MLITIFMLSVVAYIQYDCMKNPFGRQPTKDEMDKRRQQKKEELRIAIIHCEEIHRKQRELAQQKTVHVKSFYRRRPKRK